MKKILNLPDAKINSNGTLVESSLQNILRLISGKAGKGGGISGAYIGVENKYDAMLKYATTRMAMNNNPNRERYDITSYSCIHFMKGVMESTGIDTPWMIDPRPSSYIKEIQDDYPKLEYRPSSNKLTINKLD